MTSTTLKGLGPRLKAARLARGCSAQEFAELMRMKRGTYVNELERDAKVMSLEAFRRACRILGVSADWLLGLSRSGGPSS